MEHLMKGYQHSVSLDPKKCKGCTHCLKHCPTEAIRVRDGLARIDAERCIDCGECIRVCPYKAKKATHDAPDVLKKYKYKIALPPPSLYGQFDNLDDIDIVVQGLYDIGFDDVFEVAKAAELCSEYSREYLKNSDIPKPVISSACPVVVRLIGMRFPYLCNNVMPILPPVEIAGELAREKAEREHPELSPEDIGVCFISPCPAKVSYVKNSFVGRKSSIDCVISVRDVYFDLIDRMKKVSNPERSTEAGVIGIGWASTGGEATAIFNERYLAADGIENVINVLEQIDNSDFPELDFVELNACPGGCVGGVMTITNPYIAKARLQSLRRYLPVAPNQSFMKDAIPDYVMSDSPVEYVPEKRLAEDRNEAFRMMSDIQAIRETLPDIDCGSCGAPTCAAFAEDVVRGEACVDDCTIIMRMLFHESLERKKDESRTENLNENNSVDD